MSIFPGARLWGTLLFLAVTAEEQGLLGARFYAEHPVIPLSKTLANLNIDGVNVVGRQREIGVVGQGLSTLEDLNGPVIIFGAGENGRILRSTSLMNAHRKIFFCDNNTAIQGRDTDGLKVLTPSKAAALKPALIIAASVDYQDDMVRQMRDFGVPAKRIVKLYEGF